MSLVEKKLKKLVSKKKRRYKKDGFDLDLTYITNNILAMGFPSEKMEGVYRNNHTEVVRFLDHYHAGKYKVYNLCSERGYDPIMFNNSFAAFPFDDHNAPPFTLIGEFCEDVLDFFGQAADPENNDMLAAIHCKAGKGRTGVMISCLMVHMGTWAEAQDSLDFYGAMRTENSKGVTIPSQIRYVKYYGHLLKHNLTYEPTPCLLNKITLTSLPLPNKNAPSIQLYISNHEGPLYTVTEKKGEDTIIFNIEPLMLKGDVKVELVHIGFGVKEKLLHFWFNTFFQESPKLILTKPEIDKINKDKNHKVFKEDFTIELEFAESSKKALNDTPHAPPPPLEYNDTTGDEDLSDEETADEWD